MSKKLLFVGMIALAVALVAMAADAVTGKWVMEQAGRDGNTRKTTFDLKAEGAKLTGTASMPAMMGGEAPPPAQISNGKVDGNNVSFDVTRDMMGQSMTMKYEGVVSGSEMKLKVTMPGFGGGEPRTMDAVAKKQ